MIKEKSEFRVIIDSTKSAQENMACDDALLNSYENGNKAILRLYSWDNSYTVGISQHPTDYPFKNDYNGNYAKRVTGGGVLFHGHDISYSLVIPVEILKGFNIKESYEKICMFILDFYKKLGLNVCYAKDDERIQLSKSEFCQVGFEAYDILVEGKKIGGNAQRRTKKVIFQHGSIPIVNVKNSNTINERIGTTLEDIGIKIGFEEAKELLVKAFDDTFNVDLEYSQINAKEKEKLEDLLKGKYDYSSKQ